MVFELLVILPPNPPVFLDEPQVPARAPPPPAATIIRERRPSTESQFPFLSLISVAPPPAAPF